jgi:hypothetical protein
MITENDDIKIGILLFDVEYDSSGAVLSKTAIPVSSVFDYEVYLYSDCGGTINLIATYKKSNTGMFAIGVPGSPNNKITIVVNRELTSSTKPAEFFVETKLQFSAGSEYINSKANRSDQKYILKVNKSANKKSLR